MPGFWHPRFSIHALTAAVLFGAGCGAMKHVATRGATKVPKAPPATTLIALLPDPESGVTGHARVTNEFGSANLATARAATQVKSDGPPGAVNAISEEEVTRLFGAALAALPPEPKHFRLYFKFESDALTDESNLKVPEILAAVTRLAVPEVVVIGHTDTLGDRKANKALGLKRAMSVKGVLVDAGIAPALIEVASHGEADLLVKTRNNTAEPRNRRVEISVR
jgi:outer membrane protein OmpA-like peptidoglycan-associated protein